MPYKKSFHINNIIFHKKETLIPIFAQNFHGFHLIVIFASRNENGFLGNQLMHGRSKIPVKMAKGCCLWHF